MPIVFHRIHSLYSRLFFGAVLFLLLILTNIAVPLQAWAQPRPPLLLAEAESESRHTFRGGNAVEEMGIAPLLLALLPAQGETASSVAARQMFETVIAASPLLLPGNAGQKMDAGIRLAPAKGGWLATVHTQPPVPALAATAFPLPQKQKELLAALEGYARLLSMQRLAGTLPLYGLAWNVETFSPAQAHAPKQETLYAQGIQWQRTGTLQVPVGGARQNRTGRTLLGFQFSNTSSTRYYVQLVNYTSTGQVTPVLAAPLSIPAGSHMPAPAYVELGDGEEHIKAVFSLTPIGFAVLAQENVATPTGPAPGSFGAAPAPEEFRALHIVFPALPTGKSTQ